MESEKHRKTVNTCSKRPTAIPEICRIPVKPIPSCHSCTRLRSQICCTVACHLSPAWHPDMTETLSHVRHPSGQIRHPCYDRPHRERVRDASLLVDILFSALWYPGTTVSLSQSSRSETHNTRLGHQIHVTVTAQEAAL